RFRLRDLPKNGHDLPSPLHLLLVPLCILAEAARAHQKTKRHQDQSKWFHDEPPIEMADSPVAMRCQEEWATTLSHYRHLHAVNRRQGIKQAAPVLAAVAADPELAGRGSEVEGRGFQLVNVHGIALDGEEGFLLGEAAGETLPGLAAVLAPPDRG